MKKQTVPSVVIPLLLNTKEFREAWALFNQHRKEKGDVLTPTAARLRIKQLEEMGVDRAIAAIHYSVANGWTGIFEPKVNGTVTTKRSAPRCDGAW